MTEQSPNNHETPSAGPPPGREPRSASGPAPKHPARGRDFIIGFVGWYVINALLWLLTELLPQGPDFPEFVIYLFLLLIALLNLGALLYFGFSRKWIALGGLMALATNVVIQLIMGMGPGGILAVVFFWVPFFFLG